jgi:hypothetical protein
VTLKDGTEATVLLIDRPTIHLRAPGGPLRFVAGSPDDDIETLEPYEDHIKARIEAVRKEEQ